MPEDEERDDKRDEGPAEEIEPAALREVEKDEEDDDEDLPPRKTNKALIAGLSVVIFLALFIFFKGEDTPEGENDTDIQPPVAEKSMTSPSEEPLEETRALSSEPNAGKIVIADEASEAESKTEDGIIPIPKEELAFFDPLSDTESDRAPSESEEMALVKAEIPKPAPVKPRPKPKPKIKPKVAKLKKTASDIFTIQLGAFKGRRGADKLDDQLRNSGYDSFVLVMPNDVYRVRVGSFKSREAAQRVAKQIKKTDKLDSFITTE